MQLVPLQCGEASGCSPREEARVTSGCGTYAARERSWCVSMPPPHRTRPMRRLNIFIPKELYPRVSSKHTTTPLVSRRLGWLVGFINGSFNPTVSSTQRFLISGAGRHQRATGGAGPAAARHGGSRVGPHARRAAGGVAKDEGQRARPSLVRRSRGGGLYNVRMQLTRSLKAPGIDP
jgi:hypothetical protein